MARLERKYVIFKAEDWDAFVGTYPYVIRPPEVDDGVVLRKQDMFTPQALYEYSGQIRTAVELVKKALLAEDKDSFISDLEELASGFVEEAIDAETREGKKVPD